MTGEMFKRDLMPDEYPIHFAIAEALGGTVEPFDVYQGPYVLIGEDIRAGEEPYQFCPTGLGVVRLWVVTEDGVGGYIYNETNQKQSEQFFFGWPDGMLKVIAADAARSVLDGQATD